MTIAPEGYPFIIGGLVPGTLLTGLYPTHHLMSLLIIGLILILFGLGCAAFFRNPVRHIPQDGSVLLSPADGKVLGIHQVDDPIIGKANRIDIFLSVFDVHLNRIPSDGKVGFVTYRPGKFLVAFKDKASEENERNDIGIDTGHGQIRVAQIAGSIARRIVCRVQENDPVAAGQLYGLIRFGSRVEITFPETYASSVTVGQRVKGGESIIARLATHA